MFSINSLRKRVLRNLPTIHEKEGCLLNVYLAERQKRGSMSMLRSCSGNWFRMDKSVIFIAGSIRSLLSQEAARAKGINSFRGGLDNFINNRLKNRCYREQAVMRLLISPVQQLWMGGVRAV